MLTCTFPNQKPSPSEKGTKVLLTILLSMACELTTGSMLASGEFVGEPVVDIGESVVDGCIAVVIGGTTGSKNGFFDFVGEEKGLDRPIVANFWPANGLFCWLVVFPAWTWWPLVVEALVEVVVGVGRKEGCELVDVELVIVVGGTKFCVKGLVVLLLTVLHCSALIGKSLNKVSLCTPASPLEEKWVTETGRSMLREESSSRLVGAAGGLSTWSGKKLHYFVFKFFQIFDVSKMSFLTSIRLAVVGGSAGWAIEPKFRVSLSPP